jgi:hypothetical protein
MLRRAVHEQAHDRRRERRTELCENERELCTSQNQICGACCGRFKAYHGAGEKKVLLADCKRTLVWAYQNTCADVRRQIRCTKNLRAPAGQRQLRELSARRRGTHSCTMKAIIPCSGI